MSCSDGHDLSYVSRIAHVNLRHLRFAAVELHLDQRASRIWGRNALYACPFFSAASSLARGDKGGLFKRSITTPHASISTSSTSTIAVVFIRCGFSISNSLAAMYKCVFLVLRIFFLFRPRVFSRAPGSGARREPARAPRRKCGPWSRSVARALGVQKSQVTTGRPSEHVEPSRPMQTHVQVKKMSDGSCDI